MEQSCTAFAGTRRIASGAAADVALAVRAAIEAGTEAILVFGDADGRVVDFDLRGSPAAIRARLEDRPEAAPRGPGRPKLGVVAREVTLLPRHWDWLGSQPGGASVALRKLVEGARTSHAEADRRRQAQAAADRFMAALAGDRPGYEAAARALYAGDRAGFEAAMAAWPADLRDHALRLAASAFKAMNA